MSRDREYCQLTKSQTALGPFILQSATLKLARMSKRNNVIQLPRRMFGSVPILTRFETKSEVKKGCAQ